MHALDYPSYDYVIQNSDGEYYRGSSYGDGRDWTPELREGFDGAFGYTENGAYTRLSQFPTMFANCTIEKRG